MAWTFCSDSIEDSDGIDGIEGCGGDVLKTDVLLTCSPGLSSSEEYQVLASFLKNQQFVEN